MQMLGLCIGPPDSASCSEGCLEYSAPSSDTAGPARCLECGHGRSRHCGTTTSSGSTKTSTRSRQQGKVAAVLSDVESDSGSEESDSEHTVSANKATVNELLQNLGASSTVSWKDARKETTQFYRPSTDAEVSTHIFYHFDHFINTKTSIG